MFDLKVPISCYREIAVLNKDHGISIVQHIETGKIYLKKVMSVYNMSVFERLYFHPVMNIPRLYAMYEENNVLIVIEEYISGDTFQEILNICGPLAPEDVVSYAIKLCDILIALHSGDQPIIHRDIKPSNVMVTEDDRLYLIDLNAARIMKNEKQRDTRLLGTEGYAAPEQFGFGESTTLSDIFAMGSFMTALLTGDTNAENLPQSKLKPVVQRCLELNPKDRYSSAAQLKTALTKVRI
ncbi:MAG: serine/threonine protein kinase [Lachnospiraceae bacterium]|nr:serine/threonine protein kinase [Lachnospiraceae bacterium]